MEKKYTRAELIKRGFTEGSISTNRCPRGGGYLIGQKGGLGTRFVCVSCARAYKPQDV